MINYYGVDPDSKKESLRSSEVCARFINEIIACADEAIEKCVPALKMTEYALFCETGNRKIFESSYFARRNNCNAIMEAYWLTEDDKYLKPLVDYINYICDEFTWCLPAHCDIINMTPGELVENVDLFQSETARLLGEIKMCVGDKLPVYTLNRMEYEVRRRIFSSFEKGAVYGWESCKMNWATVCGAGCTMAALSFGTDEEKEKYTERFKGCLDSYLEGINDDGCCQEGMGYWSYGFVHFIILALCIKNHTNGEVDYFKLDKVRSIALFMHKIRMCESKVVSISDGGENFGFKVGMVSFLKKLYPEIELPDLKYGHLKGNVNSVFELLWFDENYKGDTLGESVNYFEQTQWYINRKGKYSFGVKGGYNDEPHNHNDIGSFMITSGEDTIISDLGCGEYVKETFREETRYSFVQNCSRGHSVPVVNGKYQKPGVNYRAENVRATENTFELEMAGAYEEGSIHSIKRSFTLTDSSVILKDVFEYSPQTESVKERIISKIKPEISDGTVRIGNAAIEYDTSKYTVSSDTEVYTAHNAVDKVTVYMTDFDFISPGERVFEVEIRL